MKIVLQEDEITQLLVASLDRTTVKMDNKVVSVRYSVTDLMENRCMAEVTIEDKEETDEEPAPEE